MLNSVKLFMIWNKYGTTFSGRKFVCGIWRHPIHTKLSAVNGIWNHLMEHNFRAIILCVSDDYDLVLQLSHRIRWWIRWFLCRLSQIRWLEWRCGRRGYWGLISNLRNGCQSNRHLISMQTIDWAGLILSITIRWSPRVLLAKQIKCQIFDNGTMLFFRNSDKTYLKGMTNWN